MNGIWAVPNKSWKRNETKAEWKRIGANHCLLTWFRGGNQYRASQNIDVTDPKDPEGNPKRIPRGPRNKNIVSRQFIWGEKATMRQIIYIAQYLFHVILMSYDHFTNVLRRFIQLPSKISFFLFLSFMQTCKLDIFAVLKHLHFPKYPNWCVKIQFNFPLKF